MKEKLKVLTIGILLAAVGHTNAQTTFTKVTTGELVTDLGPFTGYSWGDFNNDGFLDLLVTKYGGNSILYRNSGIGGVFNSVAAGDVSADVDYHTTVGAGDYDNDGYLDLLVSAGQLAPTARANVIYHNNGDGTFSRVSGGTVTNHLGYSRVNAWADYDNDGFLDFFVDDHGDSSDHGGKNLLFHNNGDGTFAKILSGAVVSDVGVAFDVRWADYDNDGFMDLLVVNNPYNTGNGVNFLYHNERNGTFRRVLTNAVATDVWAIGANCGAWGDYDNDGLQDLFITANGDGNQNRLYHNNGDGTFTKISGYPMLFPPPGATSTGCAWGDYDNDGYLDLFVCNMDGPNGFFHNNGDGTFTQVFDGDPVNDGGLGLTSDVCSWVDYDNDGFLDLCFDAHSDTDFSQTTKHLYHNNGNSNAWLEVKCVGTVSNRSAIGTKVRVQATIGGKTFWQLREINSGGGGNIAPLVAHFGLGDATNVTTMRIEWPSGTVQEFSNVPAKRVLTLTEPARLVFSLTNSVPQFYLKGGRYLEYDIQTSTDLVAWSSLPAVTITNLDGTALIVDTNAPSSSQRFYRALSH
jgi:VCBS repeat protein/ASPIC/UnbV protein